MTASQIGYAPVSHWVKHILDGQHRTTIRTAAWIVLCLLAAQCLSPAALARAIPSDEPGTGRNRLRRVQRWWQGPALEQGLIMPRLIRAGIALLAGEDELLIALDTTRAGGWEIWQAGIVYAGHTLPVAWAVIPYPWPRGRFRTTTLALVQQLQTAVPPGQRWVLIADRGFPSAALFGQLLAQHTDWTIRLRLSDWVEVDGIYATVGDHLDAGRLRPGTRVAASIGRGTPTQPRVSAWVVVNETIPALPKHKQNPGTQRERQRRATARARHLCRKGRKTAPPSERARRYAQTWVVFTTAATVDATVRQYAARMAIEQTFRDWHHGWGVREAAARLESAQAVCRLIGMVALAYHLQVELGVRFSQDPRGKARRAQWTVTDRVSLFWCAQQCLQDTGADWSSWLAEQWQHLTATQAMNETAVAA